MDRRRGGLRCDVLSCAVLSCAVKNMLFEGCDLPHWFHVCFTKKSDADIFLHLHVHVRVRVRVRLCLFAVFVCCVVCVCSVVSLTCKSFDRLGERGRIQLIPSSVSLKITETEQLYRAKQMIVLFSTYSQTENV